MTVTLPPKTSLPSYSGQLSEFLRAIHLGRLLFFFITDRALKIWLPDTLIKLQSAGGKNTNALQLRPPPSLLHIKRSRGNHTKPWWTAAGAINEKNLKSRQTPREWPWGGNLIAERSSRSRCAANSAYEQYKVNKSKVADVGRK